MKDIKEFLENLDDDGKHYAHFFTHPEHPGYYGIWIRERTPEYIQHWLPVSPLAGFTLAFSFEMTDTGFRDYMLQVYTDHVPVNFLKTMCRIDDNSNPEQWINGFKAWKQESIRANRVKWLEQYPWVVSNQNSH
ncbi:MAG: hypothetical protein JWO06_1487 [Bacteroidota bacterium]|nr:hypothetical protein [Bacteroidota bacterium]